jgi:hypothetical protein
MAHRAAHPRSNQPGDRISLGLLCCDRLNGVVKYSCGNREAGTVDRAMDVRTRENVDQHKAAASQAGYRAVLRGPQRFGLGLHGGARNRPDVVRVQDVSRESVVRDVPAPFECSPFRKQCGELVEHLGLRDQSF